MAATVPPEAFDPHALAAALRALGMFYGSRDSYEHVIAGATNEAEAIRSFIRLERPHLLSCYELESLVQMVQAARVSGVEPGHGLEQYGPR
jgi:hypothetical protein